MKWTTKVRMPKKNSRAYKRIHQDGYVSGYRDGQMMLLHRQSRQRKRKLLYGSVENQHIWMGLLKDGALSYNVGACLQRQFEKVIGRKLKEGEKIKFRIEEVK